MSQDVGQDATGGGGYGTDRTVIEARLHAANQDEDLQRNKSADRQDGLPCFPPQVRVCHCVLPLDAQ